MDPNKDVVLDVSSTSSDSDEDFVSPLAQLADTSAATTGPKHFHCYSFTHFGNDMFEELSDCCEIL